MPFFYRKVVYVSSTTNSICDCEGKGRAIALRLRLWLRLRGNATASLKSAYVYYVYDHQRHLLTTTSLQIGIVPQLLCYSVYSKCAVLHFVCCKRVIRSSHNATLKARGVDELWGGGGGGGGGGGVLRRSYAVSAPAD